MEGNERVVVENNEQYSDVPFVALGQIIRYSFKDYMAKKTANKEKTENVEEITTTLSAKPHYEKRKIKVHMSFIDKIRKSILEMRIDWHRKKASKAMYQAAFYRADGNFAQYDKNEEGLRHKQKARELEAMGATRNSRMNRRGDITSNLQGSENVENQEINMEQPVSMEEPSVGTEIPKMAEPIYTYENNTEEMETSVDPTVIPQAVEQAIAEEDVNAEIPVHVEEDTVSEQQRMAEEINKVLESEPVQQARPVVQPESSEVVDDSKYAKEAIANMTSLSGSFELQLKNNMNQMVETISSYVGNIQKNAIEAMAKQQNVLAEQRKVNSDLSAENKMQREKIENREMEIVQLKGTIQNKENENTDLTTRFNMQSSLLNQKETENSNLTQQLTEQTKLTEQKESENKDLSHRLALSEQGNAQLQSQNLQLQAQLSEERDQNRKLNTDIQAMTLQFNQMQQMFQNFQAALNGMSVGSMATMSTENEVDSDAKGPMVLQ